MKKTTQLKKKTTVEAIKHKIRILQSLVLLIVFTILLIVAKFLYEFMRYIPPESVVAMLTIIAGLTIVGFHFFEGISRTAIKEIDQYHTRLNSILLATRNMREIIYSDILLESIMNVTTKLTGADAGSVMLVERDKLVFKIVKGSEADKLVGYSINKHQGIAGWVVKNGLPAIVNDAEKDKNFFPGVDIATGYKTHSILCAPLIANAEVIGVLELINKKDGPFTSEDEEVIMYFADQAAISIERAKYYEDGKNFEIHLTNILVEAMENLVPEKSGHSKRVAKYALLIANAMNMTEDAKRRLYRASLLHDIGFLKLRQDIISQYGYMAHPLVGHEMLKQINFYSEVAHMILYHHERYDGGGYPEGLKGEEIPFEARIIAIAEAIDAMLNRDAYKKLCKVTADDVFPVIGGFQSMLDELKRNAGTQFDPVLVDVFLRSVGENQMEEEPLIYI